MSRKDYDKLEKLEKKYLKRWEHYMSLLGDELNEEAKRKGLTSFIKVTYGQDLIDNPLGSLEVNKDSIIILLPSSFTEMRRRLLNHNFKDACTTEETCIDTVVKLGIVHYMIELFRGDRPLSVHKNVRLINCLMEQYFDDIKYFSDEEFEEIVDRIRNIIKPLQDAGNNPIFKGLEEDEKSMTEMDHLVDKINEDVKVIRDPKSVYFDNIIREVAEQEAIRGHIQDILDTLSEEGLRLLSPKKLNKLLHDVGIDKEVISRNKYFIRWYIFQNLPSDNSTEEEVSKPKKAKKSDITSSETNTNDDSIMPQCKKIGDYGKYSIYDYTDKSVAITGDRNYLFKAKEILDPRLKLKLKVMSKNQLKQCFINSDVIFVSRSSLETIKEILPKITTPSEKKNAVCELIEEYKEFQLYNYTTKTVVVTSKDTNNLYKILPRIQELVNTKFQTRIFYNLSSCPNLKVAGIIIPIQFKNSIVEFLSAL